METSDSEYFESADEDFVSDSEDPKSVKNIPQTAKTDTQSLNSAITTLKCVKLTECPVKSEDVANDNNTNNNPKTEISKDDENNISTIQTTKKEVLKKEAVKLGTKLGKNVNSPGIRPQESSRIEKSVEIEQLPTEEKVLIKNIETGMDSEVSVNAENINQPVGKGGGGNNSEENLWDDSEINWDDKKDEENMWENDDWEPVEQPQQGKSEAHEAQKKVPPVNTTWGSWSSWGVSSIISTATQSVSTITQGITTVLETGIGVPEPEELARINQAEKEKLKVDSDNEIEKNKGFDLGNLVMGVSHLTKLVETTGTKVISGGLDTLETIGKKTMEVLQDGDPGLKKKRAFLKIDHDKPVLSQLLREAKEKAEKENKVLEQKHFAKKAKNYETLFDDHQGLVHLEALEMLSKQCDIKLQSLLESYTDESLTDMQETMEQVKELCELPDEDEDEQANWTDIQEKINGAVSEISIPISYKKLIETWEETENWLNSLKLEVCDGRELHQQAVETLAQLTAIAVEQFHKSGELLLVKEHRSTADEADCLVQLTASLTSLIGVVAAKFSDKLNAKSSDSKNREEINELITNVFFEAANSSSYIQDAFQLLIPVLQVGAV